MMDKACDVSKTLASIESHIELFEEDFEFEIILNAAANGEYLYTVSVRWYY